MKARGVRINGREKLVNDQVFKNVTEGNAGLDELRKEQELHKKELKDHIGDDDGDEGMSRDHDDDDDDNKANEDDDDDDDDADGGNSGWGKLKSELFRKLKSLTAVKLQSRIISLAERILNEEGSQIHLNSVILGGHTFPVLNFCDLLKLTISQRKLNFVQHLDEFVDFLYRANFPYSYIANSELQKLLRVRREERGTPAKQFKRESLDDSDRAVTIPFAQDVDMSYDDVGFSPVNNPVGMTTPKRTKTHEAFSGTYSPRHDLESTHISPLARDHVEKVMPLLTWKTQTPNTGWVRRSQRAQKEKKK